MSEKRIAGVLADFESPAALMTAAEKMRDAGYREFDCHSPFPIHGMDRAMGLKRSPLGYIVGVVALGALSTIAALLYWITAVDYPFVISGKPYFSYQAFVPVAFALTVLSSAFAAFFGMLILNRLPRLNHPLFESDNFRRTTDDGFFVSVEATDPKFDGEELKTFLKSIGGSNVEIIEVSK